MRKLTEEFNRRTYEKARRLKAGCKNILGTNTCIGGCPYKPYCEGIKGYCGANLEPGKMKTSILGEIIEEAEINGHVDARDWINTYRLIKDR